MGLHQKVRFLMDLKRALQVRGASPRLLISLRIAPIIYCCFEIQHKWIARFAILQYPSFTHTVP